MAERARVKVHMIGQAHLDPVWLWRWTEGRAEALATSQSTLDRLAEFPTFQFTRGEAQIYQWIADEAPEMLAAIRQRVDEGRWSVVNGMVVQPDMNMPQGESLVRHFLLGRDRMRRLLGAVPDVAYCVDSFGHAGTVPQVLRGCGMRAYVFMRPGPHEKELPSQLFWWRAPDGSRVLAFRIIPSYAMRGVDHAEPIAKALAARPEGLDETMVFFGLGNHGGGPTKAQIENVLALARESEEATIEFSSPPAFFDAVWQKAQDPALAPVVEDDLHFHAVGCYTANSALKRAHRQAECALLTAERMAVLAERWTGRGAAPGRLEELWWTLCFNEFHDILGGCSVKPAMDDAVTALTGVRLEAEALANDAGRAIVAGVDTAGPGGCVVLFNPSAQRARQYVEVEPWTEWEAWDEGGWGLVDEAGAPVAHQLVETTEALTSSRSGLSRLVFPVDLPPLGYRLYRFAPGLGRTEAAASVSVGEAALENDHWALTLDPERGVIVSCRDKATGVELVGPGGWNVAEVVADESDTWSHGVRGYGAAAAEFGAGRVRVVDRGPLQASLLLERSFGESTWLQQIVLRAALGDGLGRAIRIRNWLHWKGQWQLVKLAFDVAVDDPRAAHDAPFGWLERACDGAEQPTQMWLDVSGSARSAATVAGLGLIDDGKYGCDVTGSRMRLTILRSPPYAFHLPHMPGSKARYDWLDQGPQAFELALLPHVGPWKDAELDRRAWEVNAPLPMVTSHAHAGRAAAARSLASLARGALRLTCLKPALDRDGFILRLADPYGEGAADELSWMGQRFDLALAPFEVATYRLRQAGEAWRMERCNMVEEPLPDGDR